MILKTLSSYIKILSTADCAGKNLEAKGCKKIRYEIEEDGNGLPIVHIWDEGTIKGKDILSIYDADGFAVIYDELNIATITMQQLRDEFKFDSTRY